MRFAVLLLLVIASAAFGQTDVIRGRVTGPDSAPIQGVNVRATSYYGAIIKSATTDKSGRFTLVFINGEGDYWLDYSKLGFAPRHFEIKKIGEEEVLLADARLSSTIASLDPMVVNDQRNRALPNRNATGVDVSGGDRTLTNAGVPPDQAGSLAAMAAAVAGIQLIPGLDGASDMFSFLGLSGDQNNITFDGLGSGISALPPDILASTSIHPYSFDPSIGGFSGAQVSIATLPGSNFSRRAVTNADITPPLEWADPIAQAQGQKYTNLRLGGNAAGPIVMNSSFYNVAWNVGRRFNDLQSVLNTNATGLAAAGVAGDSISRLLDILRAQKITVAGAGVPTLQAQDVAQGSMNIDIAPSSSGTGNAFTIAALGNYQRSAPAASRGGLLLTTPARDDRTGLWGANVALIHSNYFWFGILSKTTLGVASSAISTSPYLDLPQGSVLVASRMADGTTSVKPLLFGGNALASSQTNRTVQLTNSLSWYSDDNHHALRLTFGATRDAYTSDADVNLRGSFTFNSLADLEAGQPAQFSRALAPRTQSGSQIAGVASFGDYWRPTPDLQVQYGVRLDGNHFVEPPAFNAAILDTFGLRNDAVPNRLYASPRAGLQWFYGQAPEVSYAPGAARPPRAVVHAGVGVFQNIATAQLIGPAVLATGLPSAVQSISCVGAAAPVPDWSSYSLDAASIPATCANGSAGTVFAASTPGATLFDRRFRQPQSLRSAADWSGPVLDNRFVLGVQGIASWGLRQPGWVDVNFDSTTRFTLANEANRPVFVDPTQIVGATGSIAPGAGRLSSGFQRVTLDRSDLRLDSRQLSVNLKPVTASSRLRWDLTYVLLDTRESYYGFTSTAGNPLAVSWSPRQQEGRHTMQLSWGDFPLFDLVYLSAFVRETSGAPYTPMVAGDVNGDGVANDRAFIFDPSRTSDSALGRAMQSLLATGSSSARDCLRRQIGQLAARGSCQAPWTTAANLQLRLNPTKVGLPKRLSLTMNIQNPLGLADLALHGDNLRGWGQDIPPDQNLLFVRGFNPATGFRYDVNQRFGSTRPNQSAIRALPFISLSAQLDIGLPRERQVLTQRLDIGRRQAGDKLPASSLKQLGTAAIPNPMLMILQQQDSLHLTRVQADSLAWLSREYAVFADSVWTPVSNRLAALAESYDRGEAYSDFVSARERTVDKLLTLVPLVKGVLTPAQRRRLPPQISNYLDERVLRFIRTSTVGVY